LLVDKQYRGKEYGRLLMEQVCRDFPNEIVYVTCGTDVYAYAALLASQPKPGEFVEWSK